MRIESQEKPKLVKEMAHQFTTYVIENRIIPRFKVSARDYSKMVENPVISPNVFANTDETGTTGTVYGVEFYVDGNYQGPILAE